ncbi:MAG: hypothetical protein ACRD50_06960 [Candidatus Acidiferrales bacterium]
MAALLLCPPLTTAQQTLDQRYEKARQLFDAGKSEDACDLFTKIDEESPGYKETSRYLGPACKDAQHLYDLEEKLYKEGEQFYQQKQFDDAKQKFTQAGKLPLNRPKYRAQIELYLSKIDTLSREDSAWNDAVNLFKSGDFANARHKFGEVIQSGGTHASEAKGYLSKIDAAQADQGVFDAAVRAFNEKRYTEASGLFHKLVANGSVHSNDAQSYLQKIDSALKQQQETLQAQSDQAKQKAAQAGQDPKQVAMQWIADARAAMANRHYQDALDKLKVAESLDPANRDINPLRSEAQGLAVEEPLRAGLEAYFEGKYDDAERNLTDYVVNNGRKRALAYFFRGAVYSSRYFLSGLKDSKQAELAAADFRASRKAAPQFRPPEKYVSPKIFAIYSKALQTSAP